MLRATLHKLSTMKPNYLLDGNFPDIDPLWHDI